MDLSLSQARGRLYSCSSFEIFSLGRNVKYQHMLMLKISPNRRISKAVSTQTLVFSLKPEYHKAFCIQNQEAPLLVERSIEDVYDTLSERLLSNALKVQDTNSKYIVGLAGPPGAGKSTLASEVVWRVNKLWSKQVLKVDSATNCDAAIVLPMDGFHLYRSQLDAMENPEEAHARRGAPWTFNPELLLKCLNTLRSEGSVYAPSFDHGVGDPVEDDIFVSSEHRIVIVEGNYLFLEEQTWEQISALFDEKWFIEIGIDKAMQRVLQRHISTGKEPDVAKWRIEYNDRPNAELIMRSKKNADLVIQSVDFQK